MKQLKLKGFIAGFVLPAIMFMSTAHAANKNTQVEPIELLIDFEISGELTGVTDDMQPIFTINGPGYAPKSISKIDGEISDRRHNNRKVTDLIGGQITFSGAPTDPVVNFSCITGSCTMPFSDGSVLTSGAGILLEGRAINQWGPVINSPDFDPINGIIPIRILGCGGLEETALTGKFAGMIGSICFNGVLNFDQLNPTKLTGSSKCTITLHTPAPPAPPPVAP